MDLNGGPVPGMINLTNDDLYASHNQSPRNGSSRQGHNLSLNQNRNYRHPHLMDSYHKPINMSDYDDLPPSYDEVMKNTDNSKLYLNPLANTILTLDNVGNHLPDQLDSRPANQSADQLDADDQLSIDQAERGGQSAGTTHLEHSNHLTEANTSSNHHNSNQDSSNDPVSSNDACETNKAASNNAVCRPNDSSPSWESVNNDPNNNQSLAAR